MNVGTAQSRTWIHTFWDTKCPGRNHWGACEHAGSDSAFPTGPPPGARDAAVLPPTSFPPSCCCDPSLPTGLDSFGVKRKEGNLTSPLFPVLSPILPPHLISIATYDVDIIFYYSHLTHRKEKQFPWKLPPHCCPLFQIRVSEGRGPTPHLSACESGEGREQDPSITDHTCSHSNLGAGQGRIRSERMKWSRGKFPQTGRCSAGA